MIERKYDEECEIGSMKKVVAKVGGVLNAKANLGHLLLHVGSFKQGYKKTLI